MNQDMMSSRHGLRKRAAATILGATSLLLAGTAMAQTQAHDDSNTVETEHGFFGNAVSYVKDNSYFRVGVLHLQYHGDSTELKVENAKGLAAQGFGAGESRLSGTGSGAGNKTTLGGRIGLYIPKTGKHLAMEVMLAPRSSWTFKSPARRPTSRWQSKPIAAFLPASRRWARTSARSRRCRPT